jgi:hypothetical protein
MVVKRFTGMDQLSGVVQPQAQVFCSLVQGRSLLVPSAQ